MPAEDEVRDDMGTDMGADDETVVEVPVLPVEGAEGDAIAADPEEDDMEDDDEDEEEAADDAVTA